MDHSAYINLLEEIRINNGEVCEAISTELDGRDFADRPKQHFLRAECDKEDETKHTHTRTHTHTHTHRK